MTGWVIGITLAALLVAFVACFWMAGYSAGRRAGYSEAMRNYAWALRDRGVRIP